MAFSFSISVLWGSMTLGGMVEVNTVVWSHPAAVLLIVALIKCCMRQTEQICSQHVRLIRVADGTVYSWGNLPEAETV